MIRSETQDGYPLDIPSSFHGYKVLQVLGCGSTCVVALVERETDHEQFSAKIISKKDIMQRNMLKSIINEINILKEISHPNIIKVQESFEIKNEFEDEFIVIIMEFCEKGDLLTYATTTGFKDESFKKKIIRGFLEAVKYLHHKGISHGDIKAENILLSSNFQPKLCDFGYCRTSLIAGDESKNGTLYYAAPELFHKGQFDTLKTDIYAIGVTLYSLSELQFPFKDGNQNYIVQQIISGRLSIRRGIDKKLRHIVERCTDMNPLHRPNISDLLKDEYLQDDVVEEKDNNMNLKRKLLLPEFYKDNNKNEERQNQEEAIKVNSNDNEKLTACESGY